MKKNFADIIGRIKGFGSNLAKKADVALGFGFPEGKIPTPLIANAQVPQQTERIPTPSRAPSQTPLPVPAPIKQAMGGNVSGVSSEYLDDAERKMRSYLKKYGGGKELPIEKHIPLFLDAIKKYPIFAQHPFLLPQISILETSAGQNITRKNNPLNWAARVQAQGLYEPETETQAILDAITAIAGDEQARPKGTTRYRQTEYYKPFRE